MKQQWCLSAILVLLIACSSADPMAEIQSLIGQGKIIEAKKKYEEVLATGENQALEREFINFLYTQKHYRDFKANADKYLARYEDPEITQLRYDYYAKLAGDAERQGNYDTAIDYITTHLLSSDYKDNKRWESRMTTVFKKWFDEASEEGDVGRQKNVLSRMKELGLANLARNLDETLYQELEQPAEEQ